MPRLTKDQVECIKTLLRMGKSYREIASQCSVNVNTVMKYAKELGERESPKAAGEGDPKTEVLRNDARFVMETTRQRLDPKHPIMTKWVSDVSWWTHLILDFSKIALPDVLKLLGEGEIDIHNPEATARNAVAKFKTIKQLAEERAEKILEYESKVKELEGEVRTLRGENEELRKLMRDYDEALEELRSFIEDLRGRVRETLVFMVKYVPDVMSPSERATYMHVVAPKMRELWGVEVGD